MSVPPTMTTETPVAAHDLRVRHDASTPDTQPPTRNAALALLLRLGEASASSLAERLGVSVQVMRRHLRGLQTEGLVESTPDAVGPGRPINRWRLTDQGRNRFPDNSDHFALGLMHAMASSLPAETMRTLLLRQAIDKAHDYRRLIGEGSLQERLERLVHLRRDEGYLTELHRLPFTSELNTLQAESGSSAWVISDFHCSLVRIAEEFPIICDQELQLIRHTFPDCRVDRVHWRLKEGHTCGFRLTPMHSSQNSGEDH